MEQDILAAPFRRQCLGADCLGAGTFRRRSLRRRTAQRWMRRQRNATLYNGTSAVVLKKVGLTYCIWNLNINILQYSN